jgi:hypothetical protein
MSQDRWAQKTTWYLQSHFEGIGSDKGLTSHPPILLSDGSHQATFGRMLPPSTVKPFRVSLVEPVAYLDDS